MNTLDRVAVVLLQRSHRAAAVSVFALGMLILIGGDRLHPAFADVGRMDESTALALALAIVSLWFWRAPQHKGYRQAAQVCGAAVALTGIHSLAIHLFERMSATGIFSFTTALTELRVLPGYAMAFNTAVSLSLLGCALCRLESYSARGHSHAEWLVLIASFPPFAALVGFIYGVGAFVSPLSSGTMAPHTAGGLLLLCATILTARPDRGWMARFTSEDPEGVIGRRLLPTGILVLLLLGWMTESGEHAGILHHDEEAALLVTFGTLAFAFLISQSMNALRLLEAGRQQAEAQLHRSEEQLRMALEAARVGTWDWNLQTGHVWWSEATAEVFGVSLSSFDGRFESFLAFVHPDDCEFVQTRVHRSIERAEDSYHVEFRIFWPNGTLRHLHARGKITLDDHGVAIRMAGTVTDITERKLLERELIEASNREQRRLGQDLHDDLSQWLTGIHLESRALSMKLESKCKADAAHAEKIVGWASEALQRTRMLVRGMAPAAIDTGGLADALRVLAENAEQIFRVQCQCTFDDKLTVRNSEVALQLYRIAQEALNNALRHSEATEVLLIFGSRVDGRAQLTIRDNGKGIPQPLPQASGMGLRIMHYRAGLVGAHLEIQRPQGGGTAVVCNLSLPETPDVPRNGSSDDSHATTGHGRMMN